MNSLKPNRTPWTDEERLYMDSLVPLCSTGHTKSKTNWDKVSRLLDKRFPRSRTGLACHVEHTKMRKTNV